MAKIELSPYLVDSVTGPAGNAAWAAKYNYLQRVKAAGGTLPPRLGSPRALPSNWWISPDTRWADCDAWRVADMGYQRLTAAQRDAWRRAIKMPAVTAYDAYMKQAVPNLLRGLPASAVPHQTAGGRLERLMPPSLLATPVSAAVVAALPPPKCQTHGLHYIHARTYEQSVWMMGQWWTGSRPIVYYEIATAWPIRQGAGLATLRLCTTTDLSSAIWSATWYTDGPGIYQDHGAVAGGLYIHITWWPALRDTAGAPYDPIVPDLDKAMVIAWLTDSVHWSHWPRSWPSKKGKLHPLPPIVLAPPPDTPEEVWRVITP